MDQILLESILDTHQSVFSALADAWLDQGATALYLTDTNGKVLLRWPPFGPETTASFSETITVGHQSVAKLYVGGTASSYREKYAQLRLRTDAQLLSSVLQMEYELQRMTADIIEQQDQLMALHQLAQTGQVQSELRDIMRRLTQIMAKLLKTNCTFIALLHPSHPPLYEATSPHAWPAALWTEVIALAVTGAHDQQWLLQQCESSCNPPPAPLQNLLMKRSNLQQERYLLLGAANKHEGQFQAPDLKLFNTIVGPAVATIENALLHKEM
ncbi:MAG: hypothetical protein KDE19_02250, partial [Caldilineaceae bacterium]|nr:hypothetical protein [Caldilineaceae bacterium]